jgi:hypothetical protein
MVFPEGVSHAGAKSGSFGASGLNPEGGLNLLANFSVEPASSFA